MADIIQHLRKRVSQLQEQLPQLQEQLREIEMEIGDVRRLLRATETVLKVELEASGLSDALGDATDATWAAMQSRLATMSLKDAIHAVVQHKGQDGIHANDILQELKDAGFPLKAKKPKSSVVGVIYHEIRGHGTYEKVSPNTFKLADIQEAGIQEDSSHAKS